MVPVVSFEETSSLRFGRGETGWGRLVALVAIVSVGIAALLLLGPFSRPEGSETTGESEPLGQPTVLEVVVAPVYGADVLPAELEPIARFLESELEMGIALSRAETFEGASKALVEGDADLAVLPPLAWVKARERNRDATLLAMQSFEDEFSADAVLVVRRDTAIQEPQQLRGLSICWVDPLSASGHLLARSWARSLGFDGREFFGENTWSGGHLAALRDLSAGRCEVAAVSSTALRVGEAHGIPAGGLRTVATTGHAPLAAWAASPRLDERTTRAVKNALLSFDAAESVGRAWTGPTLRISRFRAADGSSYRAIWVAAQFEGLLR